MCWVFGVISADHSHIALENKMSLLPFSDEEINPPPPPGEGTYQRLDAAAQQWKSRVWRRAACMQAQISLSPLLLWPLLPCGPGPHTVGALLGQMVGKAVSGGKQLALRLQSDLWLR